MTNMNNISEAKTVENTMGNSVVHDDGSVTVDLDCCKLKKRTPKEYRDLINRLNRVEGQIRGLKRMIEEDAYCPDILRQSSAASAALNSFNKVLLANHIRTCVADDIRKGKDEAVDELVETMQKLMR